MKLRSQIVFAQLPSVIVISLIAILFVITLITIQNKSSTILVDDLKSILAMQRFTESLEELENISIKSIRSGSLNLSQKKELENKISQQLIIQEENKADERDKENLTQPLKESWDKYKILISIPSSTEEDIEQSYKEIKIIVKNIIDLHLDELVRKKTILSSFISSLLLFVSLGPIFILVFSFFASWFLTGLLLNPLNKMAEIMRQVGTEGSTPLIHIKGSDEVERLSEEFNQMTIRLDEYHRSSLGHVLRDYQMLKAGIDFIPNPILLFNHKNDLIYSNQAAQKILGTQESNPFTNIETPSHNTLNNIINTVVSAKTPFIPDKSADAIIINSNNKKLFFLPFIYPIKKVSGNDQANISGIFMFLEDLTNQRSADLSITEVYETLLHEFQSPLSDVHMSIYTCAEELAGPLTEKQKEILYAAREKCEVLEKLSQDLLNLSQVNQITPETKTEDVNLVDVVINLISSLQLDAVQKGIFVEFQEPPYLKSIKTNRNQMEILFGNLMRNAIQYADPKTIVRIMLQEKKNFIEFSVNNEGAQIPPKHRKNIFKKYFKVPGQASEGAGLGLYIAKQITDTMGAKIGFKSTDKRGTTFWIHFPITDSSQEAKVIS